MAENENNNFTPKRRSGTNHFINDPKNLVIIKNNHFVNNYRQKLFNSIK